MLEQCFRSESAVPFVLDPIRKRFASAAAVTAPVDQQRRHSGRTHPNQHLSSSEASSHDAPATMTSQPRSKSRMQGLGASGMPRPFPLVLRQSRNSDVHQLRLTSAGAQRLRQQASLIGSSNSRGQLERLHRQKLPAEIATAAPPPRKLMPPLRPRRRNPRPVTPRHRDPHRATQTKPLS